MQYLRIYKTVNKIQFLNALREKKPSGNNIEQTKTSLLLLSEKQLFGKLK